jgi:hypothetical protein
MESDGDFVITQGTNQLWDTTTSGRTNCGANNCFIQFGTDGNLVIYDGATVLWTSQTGGHSGGTVNFSAAPPYIQIMDSDGRILSALNIAIPGMMLPTLRTFLPKSGVIGWALPPIALNAGSPISNDNVINGWALDTSSPEIPLTINFYADGPNGVGTFMGSALAQVLDLGIDWEYGIGGYHDFIFGIPPAWQDGKLHYYYAQAVGVDGTLKFSAVSFGSLFKSLFRMRFLCLRFRPTQLSDTNRLE